MKKNLRWLIAGILALALTSCGVFFAPLEGRWNPLDPNFGEGYIEKSLYPTLDGHVMNNTGTRDFTGLYMSVSDMYRSLMKFNTADIPADIPHAELHLYMNNGTIPAYDYRVRLILQDWDQLLVDWIQISDSGILAPLASPPVSLLDPGFYSWDVTSLLQSVSPGSVKGLLVEPVISAGAMNRDFQTTEYMINKPHLVIWTR